MRTKQVRPDTLEFEYTLNISREWDDTNQASYVLFDFRTVKVFEIFQYKINIDTIDKSEEKEMRFNIEGLSAPNITISKTGRARHEYRMYNFKQTEYLLKLCKQGKHKCNFKFRVGPKSVKLTSVARKKFINVTSS